MAAYGKKASDKVEKAMHEKKRGTLKSGKSGKKVKSRKQAIAIGLSEARAEGAKVPAKKGGRKTASKKSGGRKTASKKTGAKKSTARKSTARKSAAKKSTARKSSAKKSSSRKTAGKKGGRKTSRKSAAKKSS